MSLTRSSRCKMEQETDLYSSLDRTASCLGGMPPTEQLCSASRPLCRLMQADATSISYKVISKGETTCSGETTYIQTYQVHRPSVSARPAWIYKSEPDHATTFASQRYDTEKATLPTAYSQGLCYLRHIVIALLATLQAATAEPILTVRTRITPMHVHLEHTALPPNHPMAPTQPATHAPCPTVAQPRGTRKHHSCDSL